MMKKTPQQIRQDRAVNKWIIASVIFIVFFILSIFILASDANAQKVKANGYAGLEYYTMYQFRYENGNGDYVLDQHNNGDFFKIMIGAKVDIIKNVNLDARAETFTLKDNAGWFSPTQVDYYWSLNYTPTPKIEVSIEHMCAHPVERRGWTYMEKHGGYDAIKLFVKF